MNRITYCILASLAGLLWGSPVMASWENNCVLMGEVLGDMNVVVDAPQELSPITTFSMKVDQVEEYGRADSGCSQFVGDVIPITLFKTEVTFSQGSHTEIIRLDDDYAYQSGDVYDGPYFMLFNEK